MTIRTTHVSQGIEVGNEHSFKVESPLKLDTDQRFDNCNDPILVLQ